MSAAGVPISLIPMTNSTTVPATVAAGAAGAGVPAGQRVGYENAALYAAVLEAARAREGAAAAAAVRDGLCAVAPPAALALLSWSDLRDALSLPAPATAALLRSWGWEDLWRRRLRLRRSD